MTRIRLALAFLGLAVALPVGVLAVQALDSARAERRIRHRAVASRAFDEMERVLTSWLEREEARPFEDYRFYVERGAALDRSPLSRAPSEPFVVGAFQIDPDGTLHTPLEPRDTARARARGDWPPDGDTLQRIARVRALAGALPERPRRQRKPVVLARDMSDEGGASSLSSARPAPPPEPEEASRDDSASAYDVLDSLNRAASLRAQRKQKVVQAPRASVEQTRPAGIAPEATDLGSARERGRLEEEAEEGTVRVALDPMIGVPLDGSGDSMVVYRTVVAGERGYRQGLVLDLGELGATLDARVLRDGRLAGRARARFGPPDALGDEAVAGGYAFVHRFAEPFDALAVRLELDRLEGAGDERALYALLALFVALAAAGLFAVDRLTGVAVEYAERRSNFVAAVSHELKTPLTAIRMYGEMLRDGVVPSESKRGEYYATITDEAERLSRLINNVLEFSKLEKGHGELALVVGDVADVVREAAGRLAPHAERAGFALRVEAEDGMPPVRFDRDALLQVLFNLVDNAIKYAASAARREIVLAVTRSGDDVAVSVRDFGPGVPRGELRRVFEPFHRGGHELTRRAKGTGIGLALVRELAAAMRARVQGDTPEDGGFRVRLVFGAA
jgi:signal transduction histidine kinase